MNLVCSFICPPIAAVRTPFSFQIASWFSFGIFHTLLCFHLTFFVIKCFDLSACPVIISGILVISLLTLSSLFSAVRVIISSVWSQSCCCNACMYLSCLFVGSKMVYWEKLNWYIDKTYYFLTKFSGCWSEWYSKMK